MSVDLQRPEPRPQTDQQTNNESKKRGPKDGGQLGYVGRKELEALPSAKSAATSLVLRTELLLESLVSWSEGDLTKADVDDAYVQMGDRLDIVIAILHTVGINTSEVASGFAHLLPAVDELLAKKPVPESLDEHMSRIRAILIELFEPLRSKLREYHSKALSSPDSPPHTALDDAVQAKPSTRTNAEPPSRYGTRAKRHGRIGLGPSPRNPPSRSQPSAAVPTDRKTSNPEESSELNGSAKRTKATRSGGVSRQREGSSKPVSPVETSVTRLLVSTKQLLEALTRWSKTEVTEGDVSDVYVRMGNDFNSAMAAFQVSGIDTSDLMAVPDDLRIVLERGLAEEATPENLNTYLPEIRAIIKRLLQGLRARQIAYKAQNSDTSKISSQKLEKRSSPPRLDDTNQLRPGGNAIATSPGSSSALIKEEADSVDAAPALDSPSEHSPGTSEEHTADRSQTSNDASETVPPNGHSHTQPGEALPPASPPGAAPNKSKITDPMVISRNMSIVEILEHLCGHGCNDVSSQLDTSGFSEYPISSGGYGDVYRGAFRDGSSVAIKCLRLPLSEAGISQKQLRATRGTRDIRVVEVHSPQHFGPDGSYSVSKSAGDGFAVDAIWESEAFAFSGTGDRSCSQIVGGIAYLHEAGVVHGDLKGDNILFSEDLTPKLADFGNATLKEYTLQFSRSTSRVGMSINWVAPEVLKDETGLTPEGDIWSLGMTMLEVMTGEPPYAGILKFSVMRRIESKILPVRPEAHIPSQTKYADLLWLLFKDCWTYDPLQRPSAVEVQHKMKGVLSEREVERLSPGAQQQL